MAQGIGYRVQVGIQGAEYREHVGPLRKEYWVHVTVDVVLGGAGYGIPDIGVSGYVVHGYRVDEISSWCA